MGYGRNFGLRRAASDIKTPGATVNYAPSSDTLKIMFADRGLSLQLRSSGFALGSARPQPKLRSWPRAV